MDVWMFHPDALTHHSPSALDAFLYRKRLPGLNQKKKSLQKLFEFMIYLKSTCTSENFDFKVARG